MTEQLAQQQHPTVQEEEEKLPQGSQKAVGPGIRHVTTKSFRTRAEGSIIVAQAHDAAYNAQARVFAFGLGCLQAHGMDGARCMSTQWQQWAISMRGRGAHRSHLSVGSHSLILHLATNVTNAGSCSIFTVTAAQTVLVPRVSYSWM